MLDSLNGISTTGLSVSGSQGKEGWVDTTRISGTNPMSTSFESGPVVHSISVAKHME